MNINVTRTEVIVGNGYIVNKGEYKINPCVFTFSQDYTSNLVKKAVFDDGKTTKEMAIINNRCELPYEVLDSDSFQLRVYAYRVNEQELELVYSPTPVIIYLREGSYRGVTGSGEIITPTQYEQYEQTLNDGLEDLEAGLEEVSNVDIDVSKSGNTATVTITDRQGTEKSVEIFDGDDYVLTEEDKQEIINTVEAEVSLDIPTKVSQLENDSAYIKKEVNNLTNYYKKDETYTKEEVDNKVTSVYKYKGTVASYNNLPSTGLTIGDVYNVEDTGDNYAWTGTDWDKLGGDIDLSGYQEKIDNSHKLNADLVDDSNSINKFTSDTEKNSWNAKYNKPSGGIPSTDMSSSVQTSLGKADTAIQDVSGKEDKSNKTGILDENSTDTQYPHAKAVYNNFVTRDEEIEKLQTENAQLLADHPDITDTGTDLTLNGTGDLKMKVDVGGNSTQKQYEGYNKFILPNNSTIAGVQLTKNEDGSVTVNGTATNSFNFFVENKTLSAGNYTLQSKYEGTLPDNTNARVQIYSSSTTTVLNISNNDISNQARSLTLSADLTDIQMRIRIEQGFTYNNVKLYPLLVSGTYTSDTIPDFEPYVGNQASPNPTYKQDINNVEGDVVVKGKNRNIFDEDIFLNASGWTKNNGVYSGANNNLEVYASNGFPNLTFKENTQYTYKFKAYQSENGNSRFIFKYADGTSSTVLITATGDFSEYNLTSDINKTVEKLSFSYGSGNKTLYIKEFQLVKGTTTKDYVPHAENTVTFPLSQGQKLMLGDTLEDDGIHHKRKQIVFDGTENWRDYISVAVNQGSEDIAQIGLDMNFGSRTALCDKFVVKQDYSATEHVIIGGSLSRIFIHIDKSRLETQDVAGFKTWLSTHNLTLEYELETETIDPYTQAQQTAYNKLKEMQSYYDLTYVTGSSDNAQPILTAHAKKSLKVINDEISNLNSRLTLLEE